MSSATSNVLSSPERSPAWTFTVYYKEAKYEFLKMLRIPMYAVSTLVLPLMFYVLFGIVLNPRHASLDGVTIATYLVASYGTFGVMGAALFGFGVNVAVERGQGWLEVKRASPMPPYAYFAAKIAMCLLFSAAILVCLLLVGFIAGGVRMSALRAVELLAALAAGSVPFCAMGLALSYFAGPNSAPAVVNCLYLPMSVVSGLWIPIDVLPRFLQQLAPAFPPYHLAQIALAISGAAPRGSVLGHWEFLVGFTLVCLGVARIGYRRDEGKLYG